MVSEVDQEGDCVVVGPVSHSFFTCELVQRLCNLRSKVVTFVTELLTAESNLQGLPAAGAALCVKVEFIEYCHLLEWGSSVLVDLDFTGKEWHCGVVVVVVETRSSS